MDIEQLALGIAKKIRVNNHIDYIKANREFCQTMNYPILFTSAKGTR